MFPWKNKHNKTCNIYVKMDFLSELVHVVREVDKSQVLQLENWRPRRTERVNCSPDPGRLKIQGKPVSQVKYVAGKHHHPSPSRQGESFLVVRPFVLLSLHLTGESPTPLRRTICHI